MYEVRFGQGKKDRMTRPHILFVANEVLGWATYARQFEAALNARNDIQATVLRRRPSRLWMQFARRHADSGIMRHLRPFDPVRLHAGLLGRDIRRAVEAKRPDIIHFAAHWPAGAIAGVRDAPPYTLALDATRASLGRDLPLPGWTKAECTAEARLCQGAAHLFPMSNWAANSLRGDYLIPAARMQVSPPSIDPGQWPKQATVDGAIPQILFIGNDLKRKGADRLARWVEGPLAGRCHLHILSSDTRAPPQGRNITFHGRVPHDRLLRDLMPGMDMFCLPTRLDMSPFVLAEAAAAGLPAVASDLGGIADMIDDGKTGFVLPTTDDNGFIGALSELIDNIGLRQRMGQAARSFAAERFDGKKNFNDAIDRLVGIAALRKAVV